MIIRKFNEINNNKKIYKILIIEDSQYDLFFIQKTLIKAIGPSKISLTHVTFLSTALENLEQMDFYLVITDLSLPDGVNPLKNIEKIYFYTKDKSPILVISGFYDEDLFKQLKNYDVLDYFVKGTITVETFKNFFQDKCLAYYNEKTDGIRSINFQKKMIRILLFNLDEDLKAIFENFIKEKLLDKQNDFYLYFFIAESLEELKTLLKNDFYHLIFINLEENLSYETLKKLLNSYKKASFFQFRLIGIIAEKKEDLKSSSFFSYCHSFLFKPFKSLDYFSDFIVREIRKILS